MFASLMRSFFGSANDRLVKSFQPLVEKVNSFENDIINLSDEKLKEKTNEFRQQLAAGKTLDDILPEAFAVVREASRRTLGMRHFDVQIIGGIVLHKGMISEMKTGEGKTLVATLPVYLNALSGKGVHLVTVNDYLARRDLEWMGKVYRFLGLTAESIYSGISDTNRKKAYDADITYGTNHEFGFDYLRDNMKFRESDLVMRPFNYAIVDEVDSILIDEARTPLIISGPAENSSDLYVKINALIPTLEEADYEKDEKQKNIMLNDSGIERLESELKKIDLFKGNSLYDTQNISLVHHIQSALRAHKMYTRDVDYIVRNNEVIIIDEFTGRMMDGRRYSDGLHQAIEAKEGVEIAQENQTLASITYQNFFRLYPKLAGMAGTAMTEAPEFEEIYNLQVVEIPTNRPVTRIDHDDEIYLTSDEKYKAVIKLVHDCRKRMQPVLIGTTSIERSELISTLLKVQDIPHAVLNARQHEKEAQIVANAGCPGAITVATNMAGRGTDIKLGGNVDVRISEALAKEPDTSKHEKIAEEIRSEVAILEQQVKDSGGLYIIGTERHESRRIDNQLRGRSGRQGDPGASKFFISLDDDLMRIFSATDKLKGYLRKMGAEENEAISHRYISRSLEKAQQKVEARNFDIRKHLLKYDDVMNEQRKIIYSQRRDLMIKPNMQEMVEGMREDVLEDIIMSHQPQDKVANNWDLENLVKECHAIFDIQADIDTLKASPNISEAFLKTFLMDLIEKKVLALEAEHGADQMRHAERNLLLRLLDQHWKDNLLVLDHIRQGINLRAYAQNNPLNEYKKEAFEQFQVMLGQLKMDFMNHLHHFQTSQSMESTLEALLQDVDFSKLQMNADGDNSGEITQQQLMQLMKEQIARRQSQQHGGLQDNNQASGMPPSRNGPCPCGSGKKFKHCHGAI